MCGAFVRELNAKQPGNAKICQQRPQSDILHKSNTVIPN